MVKSNVESEKKKIQNTILNNVKFGTRVYVYKRNSEVIEEVGQQPAILGEGIKTGFNDGLAMRYKKDG